MSGRRSEHGGYPRAQSTRDGADALVGSSIAGRYVLRAVIGRGGMGAVYEADHLGLGKRVAIKVLDAGLATDPQVVARFAREARLMSAVASDHIVTTLDAGSDRGRPYLVMELLRGEDLGERLRRVGRLPLADAMHVVAQVLRGLTKAHAAGVLHRDLKPDNVFLTTSDSDPLFAKIVDFGLSKIERPRDATAPLALTGRGTILGTPFYMAPEQAQARPDVDARADLYSVGAILFECLTGRPPHTGETYQEVLLSICTREVPDVRAFDPSLPPEIASFVARALASDPSRRFASAERMLARLEEVVPGGERGARSSSSHGGGAGEESSSGRGSRGRSRERRGAAAAVGVGVGGSGGRWRGGKLVAAAALAMLAGVGVTVGLVWALGEGRGAGAGGGVGGGAGAAGAGAAGVGVGVGAGAAGAGARAGAGAGAGATGAGGGGVTSRGEGARVGEAMLPIEEEAASHLDGRAGSSTERAAGVGGFEGERIAPSPAAAPSVESSPTRAQRTERPAPGSGGGSRSDAKRTPSGALDIARDLP